MFVRYIMTIKQINPDDLTDLLFYLNEKGISYTLQKTSEGLKLSLVTNYELSQAEVMATESLVIGYTDCQKDFSRKAESVLKNGY